MDNTKNKEEESISDEIKKYLKEDMLIRIMSEAYNDSLKKGEEHDSERERI